MANLVLARLRARGVNFGGAPTNVGTDYDPPAEVLDAINEGYSQLLDDTQDFRVAVLDVDVLTIAGAQSYSTQSLPNGPGVGNNALRPAAMRVYEMRYAYGNSTAGTLAQERRIPYVSTDKFRERTGNYTMRLNSGSAFPYCWTSQYNIPRIDVYPGTATANDTLRLFICPDPLGTEAAHPGGIVPCSLGGILNVGNDVPLILPRSLHVGIVHWATALLAPQADKGAVADRERALYDNVVELAEQHGAASGEGDSEQRVVDPWAALVTVSDT